MTFDMTGATFTASIEYTSAANAFDGNLSNYWEGAYAPQWVQVQVTTAQTVTRYTVKGYPSTSYSPTAWTLQGSNDGATWSTLDTQAGQSVAGVTSGWYRVGAPGSYTYYRLNVTTAGGSYVIINELTLDDYPFPVVVNLLAATTLTVSTVALATVSQGVVYYVRVLPTTTTYTDTGTVNWLSTARVGILQVTADAAVDTTPSSLVASVANGTPGDGVAFSVDGGPVLTTSTLDSTGAALGTSVSLPALSAGTHTLIAATNTGYGTWTFTVTNAAAAYPSSRPADTAPAAVTQTGVVRWVLQDPTSGGAQYIFPINPHKMSAPHAARVFATEHTTAPDGQPLTFEGSPVGVDWNLEGFCRTQEFHDTLEDFLALPRRVYLIDHLSRAWTVTVETIAWTRLNEAYNDWAFTYQLKVLIYEGPTQLGGGL